MMEKCDELCVLVRNIVDSVTASGCGCQADVTLDSCCAPLTPCGHSVRCHCNEFISATAGPCVSIRRVVVEPARGHGVCVRAELAVPVTVLICSNGCNISCTGEICLPVEGVMRGSFGIMPEFVAQANVRVRNGCVIDGCIRLWVDFQAEIFAVCQKAVRMPTLGPCTSCNDCKPFFNLPLFPRDMRGG